MAPGFAFFFNCTTKAAGLGVGLVLFNLGNGPLGECISMGLSRGREKDDLHLHIVIEFLVSYNLSHCTYNPF